ncbi:hypothetical protein NKJ72_14550 [Mesorhizobium sp. M0045]|uniref:hypothetical protein n=1 Tax=Mesorhizobium sp. M0045 TaxID=2956857 RepID=UPI00333B89F6
MKERAHTETRPRKTAEITEEAAPKKRDANPPSAETDPEVFENEYGDWLRGALEVKHWQVWELADASGVSPPAIYNILSGRSKNPQQRTREKLETALGSQPKTDAKPEEAAIAGMGDLTDFDPHDETLLPDVPGVYVFYDITDRPVYVGKAATGTRTIRVRVKEHYEKFWFKRPIVNNGAYIEIKDEKLCNSVEKALIKFLKSNAVLNKQHVEREK